MLEAMVFPDINPVALHLGTLPIGDGIPLDLRWYALAYIAGLFLGWRWMVWLIKRDSLWAPGKPAMAPAHADDFLFWATLGVIIGGRLGYVLFYKPDMIWNIAPGAAWWSGLVSLFQIWQGGMSFHGGLIGVAVAALWFSRQTHVDETQFAVLAKKHAVETPPEGKKSDYARLSGIGWVPKKQVEDLRTKTRTEKIDLLRLGDLAAAAAPIGLFFGRIANFINGELWGRPTDGPFGMIFCNETLQRLQGACAAGNVPRHPSQLYEAVLEGLVLFVIVNVATLKYDSLRRPGLNVGIFLVAYGLFRALLETVREPDSHMPEALRGVITMGMLLSIPMILVGAWLIRRAYQQPKLAAA